MRRLLGGVSIYLMFTLAAAAQSAPSGRPPETRWAGTLKNPAGSEVSHIDLDIRIRGAKVYGFITMISRAYKDGPNEVEGTIAADGQFALTEISGIHLRGRLLGETITGTRENGPAVEFPFQLRRTAVLPLGSIVEPAENGESSTDWTTFVAALKTAVATRDKDTVRQLMSYNFEYANSSNVKPEKLFSELDYEDGTNWKILARTITLSSTPAKPTAFGRETRKIENVNPCGSPGCRYKVFFLFERDRGRQWRWVSMTFPGD